MDWLVPLVSIAVGAAITYWFNVLAGRRGHVEDLFNRAIAAVAAAEASVNYTAGAGRPQHLSDDEYAELQKWMVVEGMKTWATRVAEANEAVAQVSPFTPQLRQYLPLMIDVGHPERASETIALLRKGQAEAGRRHRYRYRPAL